MATERIPITARGNRRLKEELARLKGPERTKIVKAIEEARAHGDLSENAEYDAAKEEQSQLETRIRDMEDRLARAEVIDISKLSGDSVTFGATVVITDTESDEEKSFQIVGEDEADIKQGLLSVTSPIARALVGRKVGDTVQARTPGGVKEFEILSVKYVDSDA
jgi:transcription elongation factor GreA